MIADAVCSVNGSWLETDSVLSLFPSYARGLLSKLTFSQRVLDATGKAIRDLSLDPSLDDVLAVHLRRGGKSHLALRDSVAFD